MADDATTGAQVTPQGSDTPAGDGVMIPKARFDEVNKRMKDAEATAAKLAAEQQAREQAEAIKRGEFEAVLQAKEKELEALRPKASLADQIEAERREELLARLPESARPFAADLETTKLKSYVELHGGTKPSAPPVSAAAPGASSAGGKATPEEVRQHIGDPKWRAENLHRI